MPEGPEIKRAADRIARAIVHQVLSEVFFAFDDLKGYEATLAQQQVVAVTPKGKALLIRFSEGLTIYSHNQLYGKWMICPLRQYPATQRQLRLGLHTFTTSALLYSASEIAVLEPDEIATHPFLVRLGPDVLDESTTVQQVRDRILAVQFRRRRLAGLLLDQHCLGGLGNYLRSEVLFVAQIHPTLRPVDCCDKQLNALATAAIELSHQSYCTHGITTDLAIAQALKQSGYRRLQYRHWVFNREGQTCFRCGTVIVKAHLAGRRLYFCPACQAL